MDSFQRRTEAAPAADDEASPSVSTWKRAVNLAPSQVAPVSQTPVPDITPDSASSADAPEGDGQQNGETPDSTATVSSSGEWRNTLSSRLHTSEESTPRTFGSRILQRQGLTPTSESGTSYGFR
ncbi:unnamed protein product [Protopolystoma xenopodis]|uniref:Uncharacterized protein n=1 Tax=Protopolystoma xenopodis TaxID=117903 RepID=A0A448XPU9_9PLAT|nr:unnamed protein product [Protopolystoma xenopodis]